MDFKVTKEFIDEFIDEFSINELADLFAKISNELKQRNYSKVVQTTKDGTFEYSFQIKKLEENNDNNRNE